MSRKSIIPAALGLVLCAAAPLAACDDANRPSGAGSGGSQPADAKRNPTMMGAPSFGGGGGY